MFNENGNCTQFEGSYESIKMSLRSILAFSSFSFDDEENDGETVNVWTGPWDVNSAYST